MLSPVLIITMGMDIHSFSFFLDLLQFIRWRCCWKEALSRTRRIEVFKPLHLKSNITQGVFIVLPIFSTKKETRLAGFLKMGSFMDQCTCMVASHFLFQL